MSSAAGEISRSKREQVKRARRRFEKGAAAREANQRERENAGVAVHDTVEQLEARFERLVALGEAPPSAVAEVASSPIRDRRIAYERIIGATQDLQSWSFLPRGVRAADTVARISLRANGREQPLGTGSLISPQLLMTNNHVLPDAGQATQVVVEFGAHVDIEQQPSTPVRYMLDPVGFFFTDTNLDVTIVLVHPDAQNDPPGKRFGWNVLKRNQGKIVIGESINIIGHPMGRLKEIAIRNNKLEAQQEDFLHYRTDTQPGHSGSPVYNDQWEVVALHHSGVPKTDADGNWVRKDGKAWEPGDGEDAILWVANEGARISRILALLDRQPFDALARALLDEIGPLAQLSPVTEAVPDGPSSRSSSTPTRVMPAGSPGALGTSEPINLVFLHGRAQEGKNPRVLRTAWTAGLNSGLTSANMGTIRPESVWFPFYGDRLIDAVQTRESLLSGNGLPANVAETHAPSHGGVDRAIYEELIEQAAAQANFPPNLDGDSTAAEESAFTGVAVSWLQRQLSWVAARSGLDDAAIALAFRDVAAYLGRDDVRQSVLATVAGGLPDTGRVVLVSHSLGTVVAMDLLTQLAPDLEVALLVTAGSPLGMDGVYRRLLTRHLGKPDRVRRWVNAWCPADAVSIGCPLRPTWGRDVEEIVTDNPKDRAHDIQEYLEDARLARAIGATLKQPSLPFR